MPKMSTKDKIQDDILLVPAKGSRKIEKHLSWLPLKGSVQSIFLMIAKDTRNWDDGTLKKVTMTNREIARQFHYSARTVQRCTSLLLEKGYIEKHVDRKNVAGNVISA
ncbi:MAG: winged helix-turn-helix transcriptional regulator [Oligoflexales bacterium]